MKGNTLSIDELVSSSSDEEHTNQQLIKEIEDLQKSLRESKKLKNQLDIQIEGLEYNIKCAENARSIGSRSNLNITRRLQMIFGQSLKEDDLVAKIADLQKQSIEAREEAETLESRLSTLKTQFSTQQTEYKQKIRQMKEGLKQLQVKNEAASKQIAMIDEESERSQKELSQLDQEISTLTSQLQNAIGNNLNMSIPEIKEMIWQHSDDRIREQCIRIFQSLNLPFDSRLNALDMLDELKSRYTQMHDQICERNIVNKEINDFEQEINNVQGELKASKAQIIQLKKKKEAIEAELNEPIPNFEVDNKEIEKAKEEQNERINMLREAMEDAIKTLGYNVVVPHTLKDICYCYCNLINSIQKEIIKRMKTKNEEPDLQYLKYKVDMVRKQNRELKKKIQKIYE
ncbi:hypothetical protein GPJ56_003751 [Histomonas meleagridis]|uniref:uncharacterized protein n=1 Tax=Histomonas meleagridis TaxID=135588 RepID=UPI0035595B27|nr:hypothetical protein GPJ56_003751 [Histomonas meleagridis]KAH0805209.1 hypothetical protein GO595_002154 [Histomonas meleagridis]